jgi:hypothetical protein
MLTISQLSLPKISLSVGAKENEAGNNVNGHDIMGFPNN